MIEMYHLIADKSQNEQIGASLSPSLTQYTGWFLSNAVCWFATFCDDKKRTE